MFIQRGKHKMEQAFECLRGVAPTLMAGGQGDAKLHLAGVVQPTVQTAIAHHALRRPLDYRQLKPGPRNPRFSVALVLDEACCIVRPERIPGLISCHFRKRTIATQGVSIATPQPAEDKAWRGQWT